MPLIGGGGAAVSAGGLITLFTSTLGAPAASIDTGAAGIAAGHGCLIIYLQLQTATVAGADNVLITVNGDVGPNYDSQQWNASNATTTASPRLAAANWSPVVHAAGGSSSYASTLTITMPNYDATVFWKSGVLTLGSPDATAANNWAGTYGIGWRSTAAISRLAVAGNAVNLNAGSRMTVCGTQ